MRRAVMIVLAVVLGAGPGATAQTVGSAAPTTVEDRFPMQAPSAATQSFTDVATERTLATGPAGAFTASLLLPGAGQAAAGRSRWVLYGALEITAWAFRIAAVADRLEATAAYRDLAWEVARDAGPEPRQDGGWGYYETMSQYIRSGGYDVAPDRPGVQPEEDPATYNGTVWALARALYLPGGQGKPGSPGYEQALGYYSERAAGPGFLWSWEGRDAPLAEFRDRIGDADRASRVAGAALGAVLANHFVSAVDALIIARLSADSGVRLKSRVVPESPLRWSFALHIPIQDR